MSNIQIVDANGNTFNVTGPITMNELEGSAQPALTQQRPEPGLSGWPYAITSQHLERIGLPGHYASTPIETTPQRLERCFRTRHGQEELQAFADAASTGQPVHAGTRNFRDTVYELIQSVNSGRCDTMSAGGILSDVVRNDRGAIRS